MDFDRGVLLLPDDSELKRGQRRENLPSLYQALIFHFPPNGYVSLSDALPGVLGLSAQERKAEWMQGLCQLRRDTTLPEL